jgi:lipopolysaccharide/colanic/teichoic acid biosynthesis glycosyltransferase/uncharacterized protein (DUF362 family)/ferredoxin
MEHTAGATFEAGVEDVLRREHRYRPMKRALDLCCTIAVLPLAIPVMLLLAAAIRIDSPGPILFRHQRLGWHGRPFALFKFRTMRREAQPYAPHPKRPDDARVTRVGRFLRRTNLDELPQLYNILKNDMSLVGPRPEMPNIVACYTAQQRRRLLAKPGLTGLWQISPHRGRPIHEHLEHDMAYLRGMSLWLDLTVMLRTLPLLVRGDKAKDVGARTVRMPDAVDGRKSAVGPPPVQVLRAGSFDAVARRLAEVFDAQADLLPRDTGARIVLKPNCNSCMNALTGNTTDLRVLSGLLRVLADRGYRNLAVAEGTNSGFHRTGINVLGRLRVDALAARYGAEVIDCNASSAPRPVTFAGGVTAYVAGECVEADLLINLPKLKTHFETGMSVCLKNLIGCLIGQENKKKTHRDLPGNILRLSAALAPGLHVVDGLVAMEGCGPSRGTPVAGGVLVVGRDPFAVDLACAHMAGITVKRIAPLALARRLGLLPPETEETVRRLAAQGLVPPLPRPLAPARPSPAAWLALRSPLGGVLRRLRASPPGVWLAATPWFGGLLYRSGVRQDALDAEESRIRALELVSGSCDGCGVCRDACPMGLAPDRLLAGKGAVPLSGLAAVGCIGCLYCFMTCPKRALAVHGELGFLREQLDRYDDCIRALGV